VKLLRWAPALLLAAGIAATMNRSASPQSSGVWTSPVQFDGLTPVPVTVRPEDIGSARATRYFAGGFASPETPASPEFEVHVCLYGAGSTRSWWTIAPRLCHLDPMWTIMSVTEEAMSAGGHNGTVRMLMLRRGSQDAVALFWNQTQRGIGVDPLSQRLARIRSFVSGRDQSTALVRVHVPVTGTVSDAAAIARERGRRLVAVVAEELAETTARGSRAMQ
jgi:EpsI family protein